MTVCFVCVQEGADHSSGFRMERVGQYLRDEDLLLPVDLSENLWVDFVQKSSKLRGEGSASKVESLLLQICWFWCCIFSYRRWNCLAIRKQEVRSSGYRGGDVSRGWRHQNVFGELQGLSVLLHWYNVYFLILFRRKKSSVCVPAVLKSHCVQLQRKTTQALVLLFSK